jgi:D-serine deaminase-like pyridoxal phosphate-dependent protein
LADCGARVTVAVDSEATVDAAARNGIREVLIDINVGIPRCGVPANRAGEIADYARRRGLAVRGTMGYEGHAVLVEDGAERRKLTDESMALLARAHEAVGGEILSGGGTGTYDLNEIATEIQAGSYALMDTAYAKLGLPFRHAVTLVATVISVSSGGWAVADCGLKALGMDHGNPALVDGKVWFCSDEHITFSADPLPKVGDRVRVVPAHVDPTIAYHEAMHVVSGDEVVDRWPVDLRGW